MVAITSSLAPPASVTGRPSRASPELDANLRTCRAQLADWVTCPSAKTPQGKAKIEQITVKLDAIRLQIDRSDAASNDAPDSRDSGPSAAAARTGDSRYDLGTTNRVGTRLDTYA